MMALGKTKKEKLWTRDFILAMFVSATVTMANGMFGPSLPIYARTLNITTDVVGTIVSISLFLCMFGRFVIGGLSMNHSKKKLVLASLIIVLASYICFLYADNVGLITIAKILQAVGSGMNITVLSTLAFEHLPQSRMGEGIGIYSLAASLSQVVAPMIGTILAKNNQFTLLFALSSVSTVVSITILLWIREKEREIIHKEEASSRTHGKIVFDIRDYIYPPAFLPAVMVLFNGVIFSAITNFISIYGLSKGIVDVGLFFTINSIVLIATRPMIGKMMDKKPAGYIIIPGIIAATLACIAISLANDIMMISVAAILYGFGFGSCQAAVHIMAIKSASAGTRAVANSTFFVGGDIGLSLGSALAGILAFRVGYERMYLTMAFISALSIFVFIGYSMYLRRKVS